MPRSTHPGFDLSGGFRQTRFAVGNIVLYLKCRPLSGYAVYSVSANPERECALENFMNRHPRKALFVAFALLVTWGSAAAIGAQQEDNSNQQSEIRAAGKAYIDALNRGDGAALSALWTKGGVYVDADGHTFDAHELIAKHFSGDVHTENLEKVPVDTGSTIRFVTPEVAVEEGTSRTMLPTGEELVTGGYSAIWVKQNNRWLLDSLREWVSTDTAEHGPLEALSWMIGDWAGTGDGVEMTTSAQWSENQKFIVRRFAMKQNGQSVHAGTQRIGWDPGAQLIRSWVFDADGGIVEGIWHHEQGAWIIKTSGVTGEGSQYKGVSFLIPEGNDRCVLKTTHVTVDGTPVADSVIEFQRTQDAQ